MSKAHSSGQRWLPAIHLRYQDSESADRSGSPGAGLWAVTTDTQTNQELSLKQYQLDKVTGDWKTGYRDTGGVCTCLYLRVYYGVKDLKSKKLKVLTVVSPVG